MENDISTTAEFNHTGVFVWEYIKERVRRYVEALAQET